MFFVLFLLILLFFWLLSLFFFFFFFNDTATTEIYTLSLHDALPISAERQDDGRHESRGKAPGHDRSRRRSEEHTSELQSRLHLVCRLLLETKKTARTNHIVRYATDTEAEEAVAAQRR